MGAKELAAILRLLPDLGPGEGDQVIERIKGFAPFNGALTARLTSPSTDEPDWLLEGVIFVLRSRGLLGREARPPMRQVLRLAPEWKTLSVSMRELLKARMQGEERLPHVAYVALGRTVITALAEYLEMGKVPIGLKTLLQNIDKLPQAIERGFPGYLRARMIRCLCLVGVDWADGGTR